MLFVIITSITIEGIIGIDHAIDVLSHDGSIEQRQFEELQPSTIFRIRARHVRTMRSASLASRRMQEDRRPFIQRVGYASSPARCAFKKASAPWQNESELLSWNLLARSE